MEGRLDYQAAVALHESQPAGRAAQRLPFLPIRGERLSQDMAGNEVGFLPSLPAGFASQILELILAHLRSGLFVHYAQKSYLPDQCDSVTGSLRHTTVCHLFCMLEHC